MAGAGRVGGMREGEGRRDDKREDDVERERKKSINMSYVEQRRRKKKSRKNQKLILKLRGCLPKFSVLDDIDLTKAS